MPTPGRQAGPAAAQCALEQQAQKRLGGVLLGSALGTGAVKDGTRRRRPTHHVLVGDAPREEVDAL